MVQYFSCPQPTPSLSLFFIFYLPSGAYLPTLWVFFLISTNTMPLPILPHTLFHIIFGEIYKMDATWPAYPPRPDAPCDLSSVPQDLFFSSISLTRKDLIIFINFYLNWWHMAYVFPMIERRDFFQHIKPLWVELNLNRTAERASRPKNRCQYWIFLKI